MSPAGATSRALVLATLVNRSETLADLLQELGWQVQAVRSPAQAVEALGGSTFEAVFCDEYLRGASPAGMLAWTRRLAPDVRFFVVCLSCDDLRFSGRHTPDGTIAFPPTLGDLPSPKPPRSPARAPDRPRDVPMEGNTSLLPLVDLIEMLGVVSRSALISVSGEGRGKVYLRHGAIVHAEFAHDEYAHAGPPGAEDATEGTTTGSRALARLLALDSADYRVTSFRPPPQHTIHQSLGNALQEASRIDTMRHRDRGIFSTVEAACPDVDAMAVGYVLSQQPNHSRGEGAAELFGIAQSLLKRSGDVLGTARVVAVETGERAYAAMIFGDDNLVAAAAPRGAAHTLLGALRAATADEPRTASHEHGRGS